MSERLKSRAEARVKARIREHEGYENMPYQDTLGFWTIGIGRNLSAKGLHDDEIELCFHNDFTEAEQGAATLACWPTLNDVRKGVLVEMVFQLGLGGVKQFKRMLAALHSQNYPRAAEEMLDSRWARQTPRRAERLSLLMLEGRYSD